MQTEKVIDYIVNWLKDYAVNAKVNGFVVGVSGGIDSAVTSTLCAKTGLDVLCIEMPIHQAASHVSRANEHMAQLKKRFSNVKESRVDLTPVFEEFKTEVSLDAEQATVDMALANTRARLRMTTLYYHAGLLGLLVAGTGNKVEDFGVGFYTKYGDGGVDLSPIADLTKTQVFGLAAHLNINSDIQNAPPTDGLWGDHRTDEDQLGASYPELEWAMEAHEKKIPQNEFNERQKEVYEIFISHFNNNQHKMQPIPVCKIPFDFI
jgi:NAD+ synthase